MTSGVSCENTHTHTIEHLSTLLSTVVSLPILSLPHTYLSWCLSTISLLPPPDLDTLTSPLRLRFLPFFLSAGHLPFSQSPHSVLSSFHLPSASSHLRPLVSSLIGYSLTWFAPPLLFLSLQPSSPHFPSAYIYPLPLASSLLSSPLSPPFLPSSTVGLTRVDKVEKKPVLTSEGISIYNQRVCVPADQ